ncbi:helix-turn-helix domain-containing protein [Vallitalea guaymasensis]|uniref:helix-turn-helix domain-containing protein n=1 Tax=Vallitalea guaymasensis TaxID=1185412 RepID=UPI000DE1DC46|nr:helix-turn-helix transcriptional regulator [Vallitalea guaymasensis]
MIDIKKFRQEVGLTVKELAKESGVPVAKILLHEKGKKELMLLDQNQIMKALQLTPTEFFREETKKEIRRGILVTDYYAMEEVLMEDIDSLTSKLKLVENNNFISIKNIHKLKEELEEKNKALENIRLEIKKKK